MRRSALSWFLAISMPFFSVRVNTRKDNLREIIMMVHGVSTRTLVSKVDGPDVRWAKSIAESIEEALENGYCYEEYSAAVKNMSFEISPRPPAYIAGLSSEIESDIRQEVAEGALQQYDGELELTINLERCLNRWLFVKEALMEGMTWRSMNIWSQTLVLLPIMRKVSGQEGQHVLVAGCGLGDWALVLALAVGSGSTVWCYNYLASSQKGSVQIIANTIQRRLFDVAGLEKLNPTLLDRAKSLQNTTQPGNFGWLCTESDKEEECSFPFGAAARNLKQETAMPLGHKIFQVDGISTALDVKFDAILFGNSLKPDELPHVRDALADGGLAVVPVCSEGPTASDAPEEADFYCWGSWWRLGNSGDTGPHEGQDERLRDPRILPMRPIGANNEQAALHGGDMWA